MNNFKSAADLIENFKYELDKLNAASEKTIISYISDIKVFLRYLDSNEIEFLEVTPVVANNYILSNRDVKKMTTIGRYLASLKAFYEYLSDIAEVIERNPFENVKKPKLSRVEKANQKDEKEPLTPNEIEKFERSILKEIKLYKNDTVSGCYKMNPIRDYAMILIMMNTGCRVNEVCKLTFDDVDLYNRILIFRDTKNGYTIKRDISLKTVKAINDYFEIRNGLVAKCDNVFINRLGLEVKTKSINESIDYYIEHSGIGRHITSHYVRHTFATRYYEECKNPEEVREAMNHKNIETTMRYIHKNKNNQVKTGFSVM